MVRSNNAEQFGALCGAIQQQYRRNHPDLNADRGSQVAGARARAARRGRACKAEIYTSGRPAVHVQLSAGRAGGDADALTILATFTCALAAARASR